MDLSVLIDAIGEAGTAALGGLVIGGLFGFFAQRSKFCLRAAVIEFSRGAIANKMAIWLLAFSAAVLGTQVFIASDLLDVSEARQLAQRSSMSGAIIGGLMFGAGMILARGCSSRLLVLSANGNLRALLSGLIFAVIAQASLRGALRPMRDYLAGLWTIEGTNLDVLALASLGEQSGLYIALGLLVLAIIIALVYRIGVWIWIGALGVGSMVAAGWFFTYSLSTQTFDPVQVESMTFTGPSADTLMLFLSPPGTTLDFDVGLVPGVFLGSFLAALLFREWKLEGFKDGKSMRRYIAGAALMGFGGMLAGGCAVGAGVTGGAVFALVAWVTLTAMWVGAGVTDFIVDRWLANRATQGDDLKKVLLSDKGETIPA